MLKSIEEEINDHHQYKETSSGFFYDSSLRDLDINEIYQTTGLSQQNFKIKFGETFNFHGKDQIKDLETKRPIIDFRCQVMTNYFCSKATRVEATYINIETRFICNEFREATGQGIYPNILIP